MKNKKKLLSSFLVIVLILSTLLTLVSCLDQSNLGDHPKMYMKNWHYGYYLSVRSIETKTNAEGKEYKTYHLRLHNETSWDAICPAEITLACFDRTLLPIEWDKGESYVLPPNQTVDFKVSTDDIDLTNPSLYKFEYNFEINGTEARAWLEFNGISEESVEKIAIANKKFAELFPDYPLSFLRIYVGNTIEENGSTPISYELVIDEYHTQQVLRMYVFEDQVTSMHFRYDEAETWFAMIPYITAEKINDAEIKLKEQIKEYGELKSFYLFLEEDEQSLYLMTELIIDIEDAPEGSYSCGTHAHLLFREKICSLP